jgi:hypothetical protein
VENVDLDLLFQIPQKDARIVGGKGERASSRGSTMGGFRGLGTLETLGKKPPFIGKPEYGRWRQNWALRFYFGPTDPATNHIGPQLGRPTVEPELFWKSKQAGRYTDRLNFGLYQDDRSTDRLNFGLYQDDRSTDRLNFGLYQDDRSTDRSTGIQPI